MKHYDQLPPCRRPKSRPAPSMISKLETQSPRLMKLFREIDEAKRKQADRKAHKMISFKRPLQGETRWHKSPVNTIEHDRTIFDAALYFYTNSRRRLPVLNNGRLAGQISRHDIVVAALKLRSQRWR